MRLDTPIRRAMLAVLSVLMLLTLAFIFSNSLRTPEESVEQSSAVGGALAAIFPPDTALGAFISENLRKLAHFAEYAVLGVECAMLVIFYLQKPLVSASLSLPMAVCVAVVDESLQYLSQRGPSVSDVWIDFSGFLLASLLCYGTTLVIRLLRNGRKNNNLENNDG